MESLACRTWRSILDDILPCHTVARWNTTDDLWRLAGWKQHREQCFHWPQPIGLLSKCKRSVADKTNLIMALLPRRLL